MKNPKIKEMDIVEFYQHYYNDTLEQFRENCRTMVMNARAPNPQILRSIDSMNKDQLLKTVNNFIFKGHGFGVI